MEAPDVVVFAVERLEDVAGTYGLDLLDAGILLAVVDLKRLLREGLNALEEICDFMVADESATDL